MIVAGPTLCGKTTWIKILLENADAMITPPPEKIVWFYRRWQSMYADMQKSIKNIHFIEGISNLDENSQHRALHF